MYPPRAADGEDIDDVVEDQVLVEIVPPKPEMLLDLGLDSQLETALLVLKTRLASPLIKMAQVPDPEPASP